ncbi:MAG: hypothetical protein AAF961_11550 [Planctomycetota bacterium]
MAESADLDVEGSSAGTSPDVAHGKSSKLPALAAVALLAVVCGAFFLWRRAQQNAAEQEARAAISALQGLPVLDANQEHVVSLNLQLIKDESAVKQAMEWVAKLPHLEILDASGTAVADGDLVVVKGLRKLNSLHLNDTQVGDGCLEHIAPLRQLQGLHLSGTAVTDEGMSQISQLSSLLHLDLSGTSIGSGLAELAGHENLTWLLLREIPADAPVWNEVPKLASVKRLTVSDVESRPEFVEKLKAELPGRTID